MSLASPLPTSRGALSSHRAARLSRLRPAPKPTRRRRRGASLVVTTDACWSLEVSLATSAFVACTVATLLRRGDRRSLGHAMFLGVFGSMQLVDASLWWNEGHAALGLAGCDLANRVSTRVGLAIICLEPMAAMLGAHVVAGKRAPSALIAAYAAIFLLTPLAGTSLLAENPNEPKSCEEAPAFAALGDQTRRPPAPSAPAPLLEQRDASSSSPGLSLIHI